MGGNPMDLRRRHGLAHEEAIHDPEAMVCLESVARLLDDAADEFARPDLGLRLGTSQNPGMLGLLAVVIQGSDSVGSALADISRYLFVHSPSYQIVVETPLPAPNMGWVTVRFDVDVDAQVPFRQLVDGCLSSMLTLARSLTGIPITPHSVSLPHTPAASRRTYETVFGAPVVFEQPRAAVHLAPDLLATPLKPARPEIRRAAIAYIAERYPPSTITTATRVRNALGGTIGATRGTKTEIADLLQLHPRTLQRRLSSEGVTFESIREDVYRTATWRLLTLSTLPLSQVAHTLGFSEQSAMNRSVRRWFDTTPAGVRTTAASRSACDTR
ncbi:AraC family transcriptional regulator [uncultured Rhodococcus sp.]|uniref:AraC family transcriptional regulator n=1 Tax=uncultured Rhodococcus sp. TaxID=194249 RepID=UPI002639FD85|nr:AraC family transcriptional regulator [uncultured Rhodococcus sp.]